MFRDLKKSSALSYNNKHFVCSMTLEAWKPFCWCR